MRTCLSALGCLTEIYYAFPFSSCFPSPIFRSRRSDVTNNTGEIAQVENIMKNFKAHEKYRN